MHEPHRARRLRRPSVALAAALIAVLGAVVAPASALANPASHAPATPNFGSNVIILNPGMSQASIQAQLDAISA